MKKISSSLAKRLISSLVLIPIVIGIIDYGGIPFQITTALCMVIAFYEWNNIAKHMPLSPLSRIGLIFCGLIYCIATYFEFSELRFSNNGLHHTVLFMFCIWSSDSLAYLMGKTMGGPKMTPTVSPNKTWSGYSGALLGPALVLCAAAYIPVFSNAMPANFLASIVAGLIIGITGQSGDLLISYLKRKAALKDTGHLIPGHGGILDRIDALMLALPAYIAYMKYMTE